MTKNIIKVLMLCVFVLTLLSCDSHEKENKLEPKEKTDVKTVPILIPYRKGDKWGFCDKNKKIIITPKYDSYDFIPIRENDHYNYSPYNTPYKRMGFGIDNDFVIGVRLNDKEGFFDNTGKEITPTKYEDVGIRKASPYGFEEGFINGFAQVRLNGKWGFIDRTGKEICPIKYDWVSSFKEGSAQVTLNGKYGFIDETGKEVVIPIKYKYVYDFSESFAGVELNNKCGFIDKTGKVAIPLKYEGINSFNEGLAGVKLNGKWGFIDKTGKEVIPLKYEEVDYFKDGLANVEYKGKSGYIDNTGQEFWED